MRREMTLALCIATLSGTFAAVGAYDWISSLADKARERPQVSAPPSISLTKVVVAANDMNFGTVLTKDNLQIADWPADSLPNGAFQTAEEMFAEQETRTVLEPLRGNEPIVKGKITGPGQRASLSTMLRKGMKAVSVRVDDVVGVAGFVLPGDYVDVLATFGRKNNEESPGSAPKAYTELLLQRLRVLAVDQTADPRLENARLARTVTLEATQIDAQKIALAATIATISLTLREQAAFPEAVAQRRVTTEDLSEDSGDKRVVAALEPTNAVAPPPPAAPTEPVLGPPRAKVTVVRTGVATEHSVARVIAGQ